MSHSYLKNTSDVGKKTALKLINKYADSFNHIKEENKQLKLQIEDLNSNLKINKSIIEGNKSINSSSLDLVPGISKKINKNQTKNKIIEFPPVSFNSLVDNTISLNEENNINNKNQRKSSNVRMRIRIGRNNHIVIDRYIQDKNSFDPFDDSYNNIFSNYRSYEKSEMEYLNNNNFEKLYKTYNLNKLNNLNILGDSDDDDANNDLKQFSNSYKQFLKSKRALVK